MQNTKELQGTIQVWGLEFNGLLSIKNTFRTRKEAREASAGIKEHLGYTSKVVKVQIQVLN